LRAEHLDGNFFDEQARSLEGRRSTSHLIAGLERFLDDAGERAEAKVDGEDLSVAASGGFLDGEVNDADCDGEFVHGCLPLEAILL